MRLQGAIFDFEGTLLDKAGAPLPGLEQFLSLMKIEDVWMYLVTDRDRQAAQQALERAGLANYFRGVMAASEHNNLPTDPEFYQKATRRLRTAPRATIVFTAREAVLHSLKSAGFQVVLVGADLPEELRALADEHIRDYRDMTHLLTE